MRVTIAIATFNRSRLLRQTLGRLCELDIPIGVEWEVVVVDNKSTDDTEEVLRYFEAALPLRHFYEPAQGFGIARNRAVQESTGEYILWTDDDVLVPRNWLMAYCDAFLRYPESVFFGGAIEPYFEPEPPTWLKQAIQTLENVYGKLDLGEQEIVLPTPDGSLPYGANYAVRADWQKRFPFNPNLGPRGGGRISGAETDVLKRIVAHGGRGVWLPGVTVLHCIPQSHQTIKHVMRYHFGGGRSEAYFTNGVFAGKVWFGVPRWTWRALVENTLRYVYYRATKPPAVWVPALVKMSRTWGYWYECRRQWKERGKNG